MGVILLEVYFDDFKVTQVKSPVIASDSYYPGGALFDSYSRESSLHNKYKYQHKEWQEDLGLNLYDFGARQYDPYTLQTTTQDPSAEKFYNWSPYSWSFDNPARFVDPTGKEPGDPPGLNSLQGIVDRVLNFFTGGGEEGSASEAGAQHGRDRERLDGVGANMREAKSEMQDAVANVPGVNIASEVMQGSQAKTPGEAAQHYFKAAVNINSIPSVGVKPKAGSAGGPGAGKPFSPKTKDAARSESSNQCTFCGTGTTKKSGPTQSNIDHAIPKSRGGNNTQENAQNTCRTCNQEKKAKTTEEYLKEKQANSGN